MHYDVFEAQKRLKVCRYDNRKQKVEKLSIAGKVSRIAMYVQIRDEKYVIAFVYLCYQITFVKIFLKNSRLLYYIPRQLLLSIACVSMLL
ncbi:hypothetical protein MSL71_5960 [Desulfoluna butyratoxydans]|uniref:Uncharacterized protein n=1 Tax=Desulfoluna butyratoxydans TaxID=231438 RepID=A0A4U8YIB1_9BACT|nr:hypothetical protein MSL71_5960 [Desulfoluna butyratoxydans]